jgi:hypothetical protein
VKVNEALTLHGDSGLSWSQVYDIIDLVGGVKGVVKVGYATKKQASAVRQTANHYRHQGLKKLAQFDGGKRVPATVSAIDDAVTWAEQIMAEIDRRWPCKPSGIER